MGLGLATKANLTWGRGEMVNAGRLKSGRSYDLVGSTPTAPTILVCLQQEKLIF